MFSGFSFFVGFFFFFFCFLTHHILGVSFGVVGDRVLGVGGVDLMFVVTHIVTSLCPSYRPACSDSIA